MVDIINNKKIEEQLKKQGYLDLLPIQNKVIPIMDKGNSLIAEAPTGSGKTLAYLIPLLKRLTGDKALKAMVIVPTKELGSQVVKAAKEFTDKVLFLPDMVGLERQLTSLKKVRPEIIVGMPSRILELIDYGKLKLNKLEYIVIDEGDKVLKRDNLFMVEKILKAAYKTTPLAVFSATYRPDDFTLLKELRENISYLSSKEIIGTTNHYYLMTSEMRKIDNMFKILRGFDSKKAMVFLNRAVGVEGLVKKIKEQTREIFILHTDMDIQKRKSVLEKFRKAEFAVLITTDVFSRGLDVPDTDCVIHYDLPKTGNIYIHRSGRTSRGFMNGTVVSLVREEEKSDFYDIRRMAGIHTRQIAFNKDNVLQVIKVNKDNHRSS